MACRVIHTWTFCRLVGAFFDLGIAYLLLCCSTIAFFASTFLAFFGLSLPCPCDGLFGNPNSSNRAADPCLQRLLVNYPSDQISSVLLSIKESFPFDSILMRNDDYQLSFKLVRQRQLENSGIEIEGEASCSSAVDTRRLPSMAQRNEGRSDVKGKGVGNQRHRSGLRRRRRGRLYTYGSAGDLMRGCGPPVPSSSPPPNTDKMGSDATAPIEYCGNYISDCQEPSLTLDMEDRILHGFESNDAADEKEAIDKKQTTWENLIRDKRCGLDCPDETIIRILEEALKEEQTARVALCSELEQERMAAATAADEAMAMILRLQEEKAAIEMEARQYQRILEEKSAYEAEEMNILKEILLRREREKHFLETELEAYRKMNPELEQMEADDKYYPSEDPMVLLQQLSNSLSNTVNLQGASNRSDYASTSQPAGYRAELQVQEFQEKGTASMDVLAFSHHQEKGPSESHVQNLLDKKDMVTEVHNFKSQSSPMFLDVHMIDDGNDTCDKNQSRKDSLPLQDGIPQTTGKHDASPEGDKIHSKSNDSKSISETRQRNTDMFNALPPLNGSRHKHSEFRRHSISTAGHERVKINNEVDWLREKLKFIQEERQKLNLPSELREKESSELKLLEDIASQLQEIRQLTGRQRTSRQASLPPPSSKATSKKKRSRSPSIGVYQSS